MTTLGQPRSELNISSDMSHQNSGMTANITSYSPEPEVKDPEPVEEEEQIDSEEE